MKRRPRIDELWIEQDGPHDWRAGIDGQGTCLMEWFESEGDAVRWICDQLAGLGYTTLPCPIAVEAVPHQTLQ